jgi:prevent-host-death family protein
VAPPTIVGANAFRDHLGDWIDRVAAGEHVLVTRRGKPRIRLSPAAE